VPRLAQKLLRYLDPQKSDRVIDLGCGDAEFTSNFIDHVAEVYGVDASPSLIASACQKHESSKSRFKVVDCRFLDQEPEFASGSWDKM
jgi:ubiquinone/menaquinone biosynthesis C-methylase UbiE